MISVHTVIIISLHKEENPYNTFTNLSIVCDAQPADVRARRRFFRNGPG